VVRMRQAANLLRSLKDRYFLVIIAASTKIMTGLLRMFSILKAVHISSRWQPVQFIAFRLCVSVFKLYQFFLHFSTTLLKIRMLHMEQQISLMRGEKLDLKINDNLSLLLNNGSLTQQSEEGKGLVEPVHHDVSPCNRQEDGSTIERECQEAVGVKSPTGNARKEKTVLSSSAVSLQSADEKGGRGADASRPLVGLDHEITGVVKMDEAKRDDRKKQRLDLVPAAVLMEVGAVFGFGAWKYGADNWRKGFRWGRGYAAVLRHLFYWSVGEECDRESGQSHLTHAIANLMMIRESERLGLGKDDRHKEEMPLHWLQYPAGECQATVEEKDGDDERAQEAVRR